MSSTSKEGLRARLRPANIGSARELLIYIIETPIAAVVALWVICLPALYFALYGDIFESAKTLAQMTLIVLAYLLVVMAGTLSISVTISYILWLRQKRRWSVKEGRRR
jgi:hypothetical protein